MKRRALIFGIGGQDGSLLAEFLFKEGYEVIGVTRRSPDNHKDSLGAIFDRIKFISIDLLEPASLISGVRNLQPDEIYNLASPSFVPRSWKEPVLTGKFAAIGVTALLEAVRSLNNNARFYQASSSEIFGRPAETPQTEQTPLRPVTPYGIAKAYGHFMTQSYREHYGLFTCSGILYNHESPRRALEFLPRKVARAAAAISLGLEDKLLLGNLDARRDWGYAPDYVRAMWLMLQQDKPSDYVVASGESHSVEELVECAFSKVGLDWREYACENPALQRGAAELHDLVGDATKSRTILNWEPSVTFEELISILVNAEIETLSKAALITAH